MIIENDVWIGQGATILSGVTIENGAVIGADSLVKKMLDHMKLLRQSAKHINYRFESNVIDELLKLNGGIGI